MRADANLLENLDTQKEKRRVETSSEDPFVQLRHFEPPSLVLWQMAQIAITVIRSSLRQLPNDNRCFRP
ncbi:hypothetical protein F2P81_019391 [Scophthalmus maximus]|uniref:Uncharacterized protein n=1 Tax=Scophthalmus maximus TaxID=52904 RepID=A0A6A4SBU8_SCOMX|nr:hypothetical protein F2P81_019391 [Scophthalmus maximus]